MTNTTKLQGKMREEGYTINELAKKIGLSNTGLFNKIHNKREFLCSEVQAIGKVLNLSDKELCLIFFAQLVELNSTYQN